MLCQVSSSMTTKCRLSSLFLTMFILLTHYLAACVTVPANGGFSRMADASCMGFPEVDNNLNRTVLEVLERLGFQNKKKFDKIGNNYNIYSRLLYEANLQNRLDDPNEALTIIIVNDVSVETSASDIVKHFNLGGGNKKGEANAYAVLSRRLPRLFSWPASVKAAIIRNHVLSAKILPCDFTYAKSWITWANQNVSRNGFMINSENSAFLAPYIDITFMTIEAMNGVIYQFDRLVMPDLSGFDPAVSPTASPSEVPSTSASPSTGIEATLQPSISVLPSVTPASPSASPTTSSNLTPSPSRCGNPSVTPIPKLSEPLTTFSPEAGTGSLRPTQNDRDSGEQGNSKSKPKSNSGRSSCFPGDMWVRVSTTETRTMEQLGVGDHVYRSAVETDVVIAFSHRVNSRHSLPFVRIHTSALRNVTLSHGHLIYVNGELKAAKDTRVGDTVITDVGKAVVTSVSDVWSKGLYAPHTMSGELMVNGLLVSCYTKVVPEATAHTLLAPIRALFRTKLMANPLGTLLNNGVPQCVSTRLSQLTWSLWSSLQ